jgi:predicted adenylyl cyclase CyaB
VIELELKAVVPDSTALVERLRRAGARELETGRMTDLRYDFRDGSLMARDEVIRLRVVERTGGERASTLDWKGPASVDGGYKRREEVNCGLDAPDAMRDVLRHIGLSVTRTIEREIRQFELGGTVVRLEHYEQMDDLVEVEGEPAGIERAIGVMGIPRAAFTSESLAAFAQRFTARTGLPSITGREESGGA